MPGDLTQIQADPECLKPVQQMTCTTTQLTTYRSAPANQNTGMATPNTSMSESSTSSRTTMPAKTTPSSRQPTSVIHRDTSRNRLSQCYMHVHQPASQVYKPGESLALRKSRDSTQWQDFCEQIPIDKARHSITIF